MNIIPVLFEDHLLARFRPLTWSLPAFELRCGMFNTRERVDLCSGGRGGVLLGRSMLQGLGNAHAWAWGPGALAAKAGPDTRFLFLNGLLAPDFSLLEDLLGRSGSLRSYAWRGPEGLVAALLDRGQAAALAADWEAWEHRNDGRGAWIDPSAAPEAWTPEILLTDHEETALPAGGGIRLPRGESAADFVAWTRVQDDAPGWIWDIVPATGAAIRGDIAFLGGRRGFAREPFGIALQAGKPRPDWSGESRFQVLASAFPQEARAKWDAADPSAVHCADGVRISAGTAFETGAGPIVLDRGVRIMPHCYLEGPLYIGPGSLVKPGARLHGDSSFGVVNRIAGEIGESTFGDFANKQHEGFIGHAVLGAWVNLGALTTCSDLKNNYGEIRVDLGGGPVATGSRFVGLMMGDHAKSAIGTMFNTGTCVGFASNIFGGVMPPKFVGNFRWGGQMDSPGYAVDRARDTAAVVMSRRGCDFTSAHAALFNRLGG